MMPDSSGDRIVLARQATTRGEIQLQQRLLSDGTSVYEVISNGVFLMASYNQRSEWALARVALQSIQANTAPSLVLVGGLGMGYTLQETLKHNIAAVDVVEIDSYMVEWNQTYFASLNGDVLSDPRVCLHLNDLYSLFQPSNKPKYQVILLDVDNGPSWLAHEDNARLYTDAALKQWRAMLVPGGVLAVWAAQPEPEFQARMQNVFSRVDVIPIDSPTESGQEPDFIYQGM